MTDKQKLQEQADIIEECILRSGAWIALLAAVGGTGLPNSAQELAEQADNLGSALGALLELKKILDLLSTEKPDNAH